MAGFFENFLKDAAGAFFGGDPWIRDFTHGSKTFRPNSYQNAPKLKFLFHTYFDINPEAYNPGPTLAGKNFGLLVKTVKLPSFSVQTESLNQYNRKRIIQAKIKYDPVNISFHDDGGNTIRDMWKAYYTYYYKDGINAHVRFSGRAAGAIDQGGDALGQAHSETLPGAGASYNKRTLYENNISDSSDWGYRGESSTGESKHPFFKHITIFGLNQHKWVAYTLINPMITKFNHDTYSYSEQNGTMEMSMDIDYETVSYDTGTLDGDKPEDIITGFGDNATYDRRLSPIAKPGSNANILGQGGLMSAAGGTIDALAKGDIKGAIQTAGTAYNTFKNVNLVKVVAVELETGLKNATNNTPNVNRNAGFNIPGPFGASPGPSGSAGSPPVGTINKPPTTGGAVPTGQQLR